MSDEVRGIGIFMGGVDAARLSEAALRGCRERAGFDGPIELVATTAHPHLDALRAAVAQDAAATLTLDLPDLSAFFARQDLQIGAGGGAAWERCCIGAPTVALVGADNQCVVVDELRRVGAAATLSGNVPPTQDAIGALVRDLLRDAPRRRRLAERAAALVDGRGAERVALALCAPAVRVRAATADDAAAMHRWRNHPVTRAASHDDASIDAADHARWLQRTLADPARRLLVGHVGATDVGVVRFDALGDGDQRVSLYLDPALHGLGLGAAMLRAGEAQRRSDDVPLRRFVASVLEGNAASRHLFTSAGYRYADGIWSKPADASASQEVHSC
jgi:UDP-2,4-diacetamido-2,4,6-trideoxy-beta-L-altropyranose hydrolase